MDPCVSKEIVTKISEIKKKINELFKYNYYGREFKNNLLQLIIEIDEHLELFNVDIFIVKINFYYRNQIF
jgi:hypothetical protein